LASMVSSGVGELEGVNRAGGPWSAFETPLDRKKGNASPRYI
jgi:hypothetical protein